MSFNNVITDTYRKWIYHHFHYTFELNTNVKAKKKYEL